MNQPGLQNKVVDALSRLTPAVEINLLTTPGVIDVEIALKEVEKDEELQKIVKLLKNDPDRKPKFQLQQGHLLYKRRLVLSKNSSLIPAMLHTYHGSILGGHSGFLHTYKRLNGELY